MRDCMGKTNQKSRGFFFTLLALSILTIMLFIVPIWVATFEKADQRASQRFKAEAMRMSLYSLSDRSLSAFANASAFHAVRVLSIYASNYSNALPMKGSASTDPRNPYTDAVTQSVYELMTTGNSTPSTAPIAYSPSEADSYTISAWQERIRQAANLMGFNTTFSNVSNFSLRQLDPWTVGVYFEIEMNISDLESTMHQSKRLHANTSFSIVGFRDALVSRMDAAQRCNNGASCVDFVERQIFRNDAYATAADLAPVLVSRNPPYVAAEGNGWFYGPIISVYPDQITNATQIAQLSQYVLVHGWDDNLSRYADMYGAVIVTELPLERIYNITDGGCPYNVTEQTRCLNCLRRYTSNVAGCAPRLEIVPGTNISKPLLEINSNNWADSISPVRRAGLPDEKYVLIDNTYSSPIDKFHGEHRLWDINRARDAAVCGLYVKGPGPSFFQRMLSNAQLISNPDLGIESFVLGTWAGGADDSSYSSPPHIGHEDLSRLDWEFYKGQQGEKVKGMPGCKSLEMCGSAENNATRQAVGRFRLSVDALARYGMREIACNYASGAPCE